MLRVLNASQQSLNQNGARISSGFRAPGVGARAEAQVAHYVHQTAVIDEGCDIGAGTKIWHFSHVLRGSRIGEDCNIGQNVVIGPDVTIGKNCKIQNNVSVYKGVTLEDGVFCGPSMVFTNIYNPRAEISKMDQVRPTLGQKGRHTGRQLHDRLRDHHRAICLHRRRAVVTRNVPDHALVVGNPAKRIGWACQCGERLPKRLACKACGKKYVKGKAGLTEA